MNVTQQMVDDGDTSTNTPINFTYNYPAGVKILDEIAGKEKQVSQNFT